MPSLCGFQHRFANVLLDIAVDDNPFRRSTLLVGPPGCGKRTLARAICAELGAEFVEARVDQAVDLTIADLTGRKAVDPAGQQILYPGALERFPEALVYLSGLENADPAILQILRDIIQSRRYLDGFGIEQQITSGTWIVGAITEMSGVRISRHHWLATAFEQRIYLTMPSDRTERIDAISAVVRSLPGGRSLSASAEQVLFDTDAPENLHSIKRWAEQACALYPNEHRFTATQVQEAILHDLSWFLSKMPYRGAVLPVNAVQLWVGQFPQDLKQTAVDLLRQISTNYYLSERDYYMGLDYLIRSSGVRGRSPVAFCHWQGMGRSAPRVANDLKNQANWRVLEDIDLDALPTTWPKYRDNPEYIILADDFVGSGRTVSRLCSSGSALPTVMASFATSRLVVLLLAGFDRSIERFRARLKAVSPNAVVAAFRMFTDEDRCFSPVTTILPRVDQRISLQRFCRDVANRYFQRMPQDRIFGVGNSGALVVFFNTVPNNTLPIIWYTDSSWLPLFPASGLP